jgi:hypothetical protein
MVRTACAEWPAAIRGPLLTPVLQQTGQKHRLVLHFDVGAEALERVQSEVRVRGNEIEIPGDAPHLRLEGRESFPILHKKILTVRLHPDSDAFACSNA